VRIVNPARQNQLMTLFYDRGEVADVDELLRRYRVREFASPTRSTVPLLCLLREDATVGTFVGDTLKLGDSPADLHLEYTVRPPLGRGTSSHTDLMVIGGDRSVAIEAKWTEPPYADVGTWLKNDDPNRREVMNGWLSLLQPHAIKPLRLDDFRAARYQMVHRAASACATGASPCLAYLQFTPSPTGTPPPHRVQLLADAQHLRDLLGVAAFPILVFEAQIRPTDAFEAIKDLPKGTSATATAVRERLSSGTRLFNFDSIQLVPND
jgi:Domain of unknown function (DUF6946)